MQGSVTGLTRRNLSEAGFIFVAECVEEWNGTQRKSSDRLVQAFPIPSSLGSIDVALVSEPQTEEVMMLRFPVKAETSENPGVGAAGFAPNFSQDLGREPRWPRRMQQTRILDERHSAARRLPILGPLTRRLASWIVVVDFGRIGFNWQVDP